MSKLLTEKQVLKQLNIKDFRHISKDKVMEFASMIHKMDPDVAKKALEQFPDFANIALEALNDYKAILEKAVDANEKGSKQCYDVYTEIVSALKDCIKQENISFAEKQYYIDKMMEIAKMAEKLEGENKKFNWGVIKAGAVVVAAVVGFGASLLGGKVNIKLPKGKG